MKKKVEINAVGARYHRYQIKKENTAKLAIKLFKISIEEYDKIFVEQGGKCKICKRKLILFSNSE